VGFRHFSAGAGCMRKASVGHISTQSVQLTQSAGRGIHGRPPAIARQSVGQIVTQTAEPVQRASSKFGSSAITAKPPPWHERLQPYRGSPAASGP
jgi:hypothetical protein